MQARVGGFGVATVESVRGTSRVEVFRSIRIHLREFLRYTFKVFFFVFLYLVW